MPEDELDGSLLCKKACKDRKGQAAKIVSAKSFIIYWL